MEYDHAFVAVILALALAGLTGCSDSDSSSAVIDLIVSRLVRLMVVRKSGLLLSE